MALKLVRHLIAIALLPFVVIILIPLWIAHTNHITPRLGASPLQILAQSAGCLLLIVGLFLFASSLSRFVGEGDGTLAPWDPPRKLVFRGPYRYVRNPMISGVVFVLFGEAGILLSRSHLVWTLIFFAINGIYIPLLEEPQLLKRFGEDYAQYCRHVPRLLPRVRAWHG
jgi:protein-S-isoprenylcysteine O-methyltransferase Ste14